MFHRNKFYIFIVASLLLNPVNSQAFPTHNLLKDYVILLHGLGRTSRSMRPLEKHLKKHGYCVINIGYPSRKFSIEKLANYIQSEIQMKCTDKAANIHFVTHSLGGIILRYYLQNNQLERLGRVVMLSPPNKGSEIIDRMEKYFFFSMIMGPASLQLGTDPDSIPNILEPVDFELGIIAGTATLNPLFSLMIPGDDDGIVSVERSKVSGMKDFLTVPHSHTFIMKSKEVKGQIVHFLNNGRFYKITK